MNGPSMLQALQRLLDSDPDGDWVKLPATWFADKDGVVHGREDHAANTNQNTSLLQNIRFIFNNPGAQTAGSNTSSRGGLGIPQPTHGTLGELLTLEHCLKKGCVSILKAAGEEGQEVGKVAQLVAEAAICFDKAVKQAADHPYRLVAETDAWQRKILDLVRRRSALLNGTEKSDRITEEFIEGIQRLRDEATAQICSDKNRARLLNVAANLMLWGPDGPMSTLVPRLAGTVDTYGKLIDLSHGELTSREQTDWFISSIDDLQPMVITQVADLRVGENVHENAKIGDLLRLRWQEQASTELIKTRDAIAEAVAEWEKRVDLCVVDVNVAREQSRVLIQNTVRTLMQNSGGSKLPGNLNHVQYSPVKGSPAFVINDEVKGPYDQFAVRDQSLFRPTATVEDVIDEALTSFGDPRRNMTGIRQRLVVLPTVIGAAITMNDAVGMVELGVSKLDTSNSALIDTAEALLGDGGVYVDLRSAWEAAQKL